MHFRLVSSDAPRPLSSGLMQSFRRRLQHRAPLRSLWPRNGANGRHPGPRYGDMASIVYSVFEHKQVQQSTPQPLAAAKYCVTRYPNSWHRTKRDSHSVQSCAFVIPLIPRLPKNSRLPETGAGAGVRVHNAAPLRPFRMPRIPWLELALTYQDSGHPGKRSRHMSLNPAGP